MGQTVSISDIIKTSWNGAIRVVAPTLLFAVAFALVAGLLAWSAGVLPDGVLGTTVFTALVLATFYARCLFSAAMYRQLLPPVGSITRAASHLLWSWMLIIVVAAIMGTIVLLFFSLIGSSLGVASGGDGQGITDMTREMREAGTFYPLFALFVLTLLGIVWFAVRIMLFSVATVARGAVHVFRTWYWTKGHLRVLLPGALLFVVLPFVFSCMLGNALLAAMMPEGGSPEIAGLGAALYLFILTPAAWLGHSFSAAVLEKLVPQDAAVPS